MSSSQDQISIQLTVSVTDSGQRLDRWLTTALRLHNPNLYSRSEIQRWIKLGHVLVDQNKVRSNFKLESGQRVQVHIPPKIEVETLQPEAIPLQITFEDENLIVVDKPAGQVVHPAPGHSTGTLVHALLHHCPDIDGVGGERRPGIVHRLDKETSGLLVVAKNDSTHRFLQRQFQERTVYKEYLALVDRVVDPPCGRISAPIGRHPVDRKRQAILPIDPNSGLSRGREAITDYHTLDTYYTQENPHGNMAQFTLLRTVLHTGRTHQIRVHFAWRKHPIVGDTTYGFRHQRLSLNRHFLHAHRLRLTLPHSKEKTEFVADLPDELQSILDQLTTTKE
ncbi:RluA family pseudouridine synthase [Chloroflexi bacterium TSY]|nr:RluA family pseudouridine synthase [Chloroflexi bacterium TSY]